MKISTGKVVDGQIVLDGESLREGTSVTILSRESSERFEVSAETEAEILSALEESRRGETVDGLRLLRDLREAR